MSNGNTNTKDFQEALRHGPGRFNAVALYRRSGDLPVARLRECAASLLGAVEARTRGTPHILVAVAPALLAGHGAGSRLTDGADGAFPRGSGATTMPSTQMDVLVQVAASNEDDRLYALRLAQCVLAPDFMLEREWLGGRTLRNREAFGYRDGIEAPGKSAVRAAGRIEGGPADGASWIVYQRYAQDVTAFYRELQQPHRDAVIGRTPDGQSVHHPPPGGGKSHVAAVAGTTGSPSFVRRGFAYRQDGIEGLVFVAASERLAEVTDALDRMLAPGDARDRMLEFASAEEGGVYLAPPSAAWLLDGASPRPIPPGQIASAASYGGDHDYLLYEVTTGTFAYMKRLIELNAFDPDNPQMKELLRMAHHVLSGGEASVHCTGTPIDTVVRELGELLEGSIEAANQLNREHGYYISITY